MEALAHWDDVPVEHEQLGPMHARWRGAAGAGLGMNRIEVSPGGQSQVSLRYAGVRFRVEPVDYWDGEGEG